MDMGEQAVYMVKLRERVKNITKPYKLLTVLLFFDQLMKSSVDVVYPQVAFLGLKLEDTK